MDIIIRTATPGDYKIIAEINKSSLGMIIPGNL